MIIVIYTLLAVKNRRANTPKTRAKNRYCLKSKNTINKEIYSRRTTLNQYLE